MTELVVTRSVRLAAPAGDVWAFAATPAGVNFELMPWVRMTVPRRVQSLTAADVSPGKVLCDCWVLAGGVVPFDRHHLALDSVTESVDGPSGFVEESTSWMQARWRHERTVEPVDDGSCRVTDVVTVRPRLGLAMPLVRRVVPAVFEHRHRRLQQRYAML